MQSFKVGDPVLVVGNPCTIRTCIGLYGYVWRAWTEAESQKPGGSLSLMVLSNPALDGWDAKSDKAAEARGDFRTSLVSVQASDLRPLTGKARLARVAAMKKANAKQEAANKNDMSLQALHAKLDSAEFIAKEQAQRVAVAAENARIGDVFKLPGRIERGDKSAFPAFHDPEVEAITAERDGYAYAKDRSKLTVTDFARWGQANKALECVSHWSRDPDVRALVRELDLDPFCDSYEAALYSHKGWVFATRADLRKEAIKLWNKGLQITSVGEAEDADTSWSSHKGAKAPGFFINYATRRKLPVPN